MRKRQRIISITWRKIRFVRVNSNKTFILIQPSLSPLFADLFFSTENSHYNSETMAKFSFLALYYFHQKKQNILYKKCFLLKVLWIPLRGRDRNSTKSSLRNCLFFALMLFTSLFGCFFSLWMILDKVEELSRYMLRFTFNHKSMFYNFY